MPNRLNRNERSKRTLQAEIAGLQRKMESLGTHRNVSVVTNVPRASRSRKRKAKANVQRTLGTTPGAYNTLMSNRGPGVTPSGSAGGIRLKHTEFWFGCNSVTTGTQTFGAKLFKPGDSGLTHLDNYAKINERYKLLECIIHYRTRVGTTRDGAILFGIDWDDRPGEVAAMTDLYVKNPARRAAIWQECDMSLPRDQLMSRKIRPTVSTATPAVEEFEQSAFQLVWGMNHSKPAAAETLGEFWVTYVVEFSGPRRA